jgi:hypothetical protein
MALHDISSSQLDTSISRAEKILQSTPDRLWLDCFRYCQRRRNISDTSEEYEFKDGSTLILDTSSAIPIPVRVKS